jgi:hypothetical protein
MPEDKKTKPQEKKKDNPTSQPDPETLHKTDPQENMKGPISSLLNNAKENIEEHGDERPSDDDNKKE